MSDRPAPAPLPRRPPVALAEDLCDGPRRPLRELIQLPTRPAPREAA